MQLWICRYRMTLRTYQACWSRGTLRPQDIRYSSQTYTPYYQIIMMWYHSPNFCASVSSSSRETGCFAPRPTCKIRGTNSWLSSSASCDFFSALSLCFSVSFAAGTNHQFSFRSPFLDHNWATLATSLCITQETCSRPWYLTRSFNWSEKQQRRTMRIITGQKAGVSFSFCRAHISGNYKTQNQKIIQQANSQLMKITHLPFFSELCPHWQQLTRIFVLEGLIFRWLLRTGSSMVLNTFNSITTITI